ncbi:MAG: biotin/lipoyl-binding carrier protein [Longispora sp.]|nr:biotin/lipoyl-binding carrier protein [Longispora sp. (in: high G+C Gram-positive bacteria)]
MAGQQPGAGGSAASNAVPGAASKKIPAELPKGEQIRAEMVANVWKVVVREGDAVEDGDTLVILESMKMEIPVLAETNGNVLVMAVAEGDVIQEGDLIAVVG